MIQNEIVDYFCASSEKAKIPILFGANFIALKMKNDTIWDWLGQNLANSKFCPILRLL